MNNLTLPTERLVLREFPKGDWQAVYEYASDPEVVHYMLWGLNTEEETRDFIKRAMASYEKDPRREYQFAVTLEEENRLIGSCGLCVSNPDHQEAWIGYYFNWEEHYHLRIEYHQVILTSRTNNLTRTIDQSMNRLS